ncbi:thioredoxin family protein [Herbaspirillum sp. RTI4]|uniref:thioredoxin family protein n=1 Tax=Herbaspirillum sp. RTI4 TaxID=3048640 RepID=UPI002AB411EF|nr:thioredoxin family protein [Herbaspirillum sp. RTI4]MDY7578648.1 thioredoxin family protein [Herbaspirillum sp. RTI4]MEA9980654.1 thioredoxin family protein [Herbaspirillum sp. RTI4]
MSFFILDNSKHSTLEAALDSGSWVIACLCAEWCGSCREYGEQFAALAQRHPQHHFVWIDIEDEADLVGDLDVDNFPTLLIQHGGTVAFFGTVKPDIQLADRLFKAQRDKSPEELMRDARASAEHVRWQEECNLQTRLRGG